jgi:ABC-type polysaccharide/polyol phosphate transport system ATPase subunit
MSEPAIHIRNLCKEFTISHSGAGSLKTALLWWKRKHRETLSVLNGISLDVAPGECLALVGRNGAGKSTLLSLLARVYKPTSGTIEVRGRIAPLLELGAGFHPDLTGAENVLFNAVILGLTRAQVKERMEAIIEFAGVRAHMDAPVRTYSSGMLARLGFAIAVHVDADVLIVDEVLAVGDFEFEEKCYRRISEFRSEGGAVFFVSHDLDSVRRIADRCIWLQDGRIAAEGEVETVLSAYVASGGVSGPADGANNA